MPSPRDLREKQIPGIIQYLLRGNRWKVGENTYGMDEHFNICHLVYREYEDSLGRGYRESHEDWLRVDWTVGEFLRLITDVASEEEIMQALGSLALQLEQDRENKRKDETNEPA